MHPDTFKGCNRKFSAPKAAKLAVERHNSVKSDEKLKKIKARLQGKTKKIFKRLSDLGIDYSMDQSEVAHSSVIFYIMNNCTNSHSVDHCATAFFTVFLNKS